MGDLTQAEGVGGNSVKSEARVCMYRTQQLLCRGRTERGEARAQSVSEVCAANP